MESSEILLDSYDVMQNKQLSLKLQFGSAIMNGQKQNEFYKI